MSKKFITQIKSTVPNGTAPLILDSTTVVANLNADLLDGQHGSYYAPIASPTFTGTPASPTAAVDANTTQIATTAYVVGQGYSKLTSPTFTGTPAAPTAAVGTNTTQIATTAFVNSEISNDAIGKSGLQIITMAAGASIATASQVNTFQILQNTAGSDSFITFHISGDYAAHFGIDGTTNDLSYGGWSAGAVKYRVWHAGNQTTLFTSPTFTGTPAAPTATAGTNTTQIATTAFVQTAVNTTIINTQTVSYILTLGDSGEVVEMNSASANTLTVPPSGTTNFPIGTSIDIVQYGAGQTTITAGVGVTLRSSGSKLKLTGQYSAATLYKRGTDEWMIMGDLTA